jgi:HEAT repeat protein
VRRVLTIVLMLLAVLGLGSAAWMWYARSSGRGDARQSRSAGADDRLQAIDRLAERHSGAARDTLTRLTKDPDPQAALSAVRAMGGAPQEYRQTLVEVASGHSQGLVRGEAAAALGNYVGPQRGEHLRLLTTMLTSDGDAEARAGAARGLARLAELKTLPQLVQALRDPDQRVRVQAITAIGQITATRFPYRAELPPQQQERTIRDIENHLRSRGLL